jgi:hypothetical protein
LKKTLDWWKSKMLKFIITKNLNKIYHNKVNRVSFFKTKSGKIITDPEEIKKKFDTIDANKLLTLYLKEKQYEKGRELIKGLKKKYTELDKELYNTISSFYIKSNDMENFEKNKLEMKSKGFYEYDDFATNTLFQKIVKTENDVKIMKVFGELDRKSQVNIFTYNILLGHFFNNQLKFAEIYKMLLKSKIGFDTATLSILVKFNMKKKKYTLEKALSMVEGYQLDTQFYNDILLVLIERNDIKDIEKLTKKYQLDNTSYSILLGYFDRNGDTKNFLIYYERMNSEKLKPNSFVYKAVLSFFLKHDEDMVNQTLKEMRKRNVNLNHHIYFVLLKHFISKGDDSQIEQIYEDVIENLKEPGVYMLSALLQYYLKNNNFEKFKEVKKSYEKFNIKPDQFSLNLFLEKSLKVGDKKEFLKRFKSMETKDVFTYHLIFQYCLENEEFDKLEKYILNFEELNIRPVKQTCELFNQYYEKNRDDRYLNFMKLLKIIL